MDIAADRGLEEGVVRSNRIGAINSWSRNQPEEIVASAAASLRMRQCLMSMVVALASQEQCG